MQLYLYVLLMSVLVTFGGCHDKTVTDMPITVASVTVSPDNWDANRIGQRQQLTATAWDADNNPIPDVQFTWQSSITEVAQVDVSGNVTAFSAGSSIVTATAEGMVATTKLTVTSEVESDADVLMYTVWFARSDDAPALLVDGNLLVLSDMFCFDNDKNITGDGSFLDPYVIVSSEWTVCPANASFPDDKEKQPNDVTVLTAFPNPPDPTTPWQYSDVEEFQWEGDRIGILSDMAAGMGTFRVVDRHEEWKTLAIGNVSDFQLENDRIGIIVDNGALAVIDSDNVKNTASYKPPQPPICRENPLPLGPPEVCIPIPATWATLETSGVYKFLLHKNYIGVLRDNGTLSIRNGIDGDWIKQEYPGFGFTEFGMETVVKFEERCIDRFPLPPICAEVPVGTVLRIGVLSDSGEFLVKDGIDGEWSTPEPGAQEFQLTGSFIGLLGEDGTLRVKNGIDGAWILDIRNVTDFDIERLTLTDVRIGSILSNGDFLIKDGINNEWETVASGVQKMQLQEKFIGALFADDTFGILDANKEWRSIDIGTGNTDKVTQFRVVVDTPVPPERTTPTSFNKSQRECAGEGSACFPDRALGTPSDFYGRFCGGGHPDQDGDTSWSWAITRGPIDSMDALCVHHDASYPVIDTNIPRLNAVSWTPESGSGTQYLCTVRYGLENAKLTKNGIIKDKNERDNWEALDALYGTIYYGINSFWTGSAAGCPVVTNFRGDVITDELTTFTNATKAKHNN